MFPRTRLFVFILIIIQYAVAALIAVCPAWTRSLGGIDSPFGRAVVDLLPADVAALPPETRLLHLTQSVETALSAAFGLRRIYYRRCTKTTSADLAAQFDLVRRVHAGDVDYWVIVALGEDRWGLEFAHPAATRLEMRAGRALMLSANASNSLARTDGGSGVVLLLAYSTVSPWVPSFLASLRRAKTLEVRDIQIGRRKRNLVVRWPRRRFTPLA